MPAANRIDLLPDWTREKEFVPQWKRKTGVGSVDTFRRWRRDNTVPKQLEWTRAGRAVMWRVKPEVSA